MNEPQADTELKFETTTIMFADVVESVRLIEQDESANVRRISSLLRRLARETVPAHGGLVLERRGDGLLLRFADARAAAACALALHAQAGAASSGLGVHDRLCLRVGVHVADLIVDDGSLFGRGINLAARLTTLAGPGETVVSAAVRDRLTDRLDGELSDLGECYLKHLAEPVRAYRLAPPPPDARVTQACGDTVASARATPLPMPEAWPGLQKLMLAVLPLSAERGSGLLPDAADILVDQLTAVLSQSPVLGVISRLSAQAFRGRLTGQGEAGAALRADYVLGGRCAQDRGRLMATLELLHCGSGEVIWERQVACAAPELLSTESDTVARISCEVTAALTQTELRIAHGRPLPNLAAHTLYLASVTLLHRFSRADFEHAHAMLETLRERAPRHAAPVAWLARWHVFRIVQGWSTDVRQDGAQASDYAQRALDHDPRSALALAMAGSVQAGVHRDMPAASRYYDQALASNPSEPLAWLLKGVAHGFMGEAGAALASSERSLALSPLDPLRFYYDSLSASAAMGAQDYPRAIELAQRAIRANCLHGSAYRALAVAQVMLEQLDAARETVRRLLAVEPQSSVRQFLARAAVDSAQNQVFGRALATAGLPAG